MARYASRSCLKRPPFVSSAIVFFICIVLWVYSFQHLHRSSSSNSSSSHLDPPYAPISPIPKNIWQIFFPPQGTQRIERALIHAGDWVSLGPDYTYTMIGSQGADAFVQANFADRPEVTKAFSALHVAAMKSDLLRYLLLLNKGGVYGDVDTKPLVRLDDWIAPEKRADVKLIVALEYDEADGFRNGFKYAAQFCQWTIAAAPDHPVLANMVHRAIAGLQDIAREQGTTLDNIRPSDFNVVNATGPVAWTEVIFDVIRARSPHIKDLKDLTGIREPQYHGDIAVLPAYSFMAEPLDEWGLRGKRCLVRHYFKGAWKTQGP